MVVKAVDESTEPPELVALKLLPRGQVVRDFKTYLTREIVHQSSLRHPFIVRLREVCVTQMKVRVQLQIGHSQSGWYHGAFACGLQ